MIHIKSTVVVIIYLLYFNVEVPLEMESYQNLRNLLNCPLSPGCNQRHITRLVFVAMVNSKSECYIYKQHILIKGLTCLVYSSYELVTVIQ